ncbi:probable asparagine--tRNA ligase, mitochondrial isoform X2 [Folsomia candida]|uniref:probable asparagine--tRNA ligase, mitochondrial isoform X2 n=1 Tax=Folsomia candida TaxID=158441 RepID=UPI0016050757|nr:probable asparagine--tRNA ligase, mitochondrial isoform X2 [Folsomia candida]
MCAIDDINKTNYNCQKAEIPQTSRVPNNQGSSYDTTVATLRKKNYMRPAKSVREILTKCQEGDKVRVQGWVKGLRKQKKFVFLDICDGLSFHNLPVVVKAEDTPSELNMHTSIDVYGILAKSPNNPALLELHPTSEIKVFGGCDQLEYPFAGKSKYTQEHIRQFLNLRPKTKKFGSVLRIRNATTQAIYDFFKKNDFVNIHTPIVTSNDCEGGGETFTIRPHSEELLKEMMSENKLEGQIQNLNLPRDEIFFNKQVYLSVSGQFHLESAVGGLGKVWTFSPAFRAENNKSTRHLSEFYMLEAEIAFAYEIEDILEIMEDLVKFCITQVLFENGHDWSIATENDTLLRGLLENILKHPFTVMTFEEAKHILESKANSAVSTDKGLSREQELLLVEQLNNNVPVFVINWPSHIKPFYMRQCVNDISKVSAVDLLVPTIGELCGGSLREANPLLLERALARQDPSGALTRSLAWYLELRKYGGVPSGGFGLGFDRLIQLMTGVKTIKDVSPFPRWAHHCAM